jgi:hypothetical protein
MSQVVQANQIQLPKLEEGERYVYDPQAGELMVERAAQPPQTPPQSPQ